MNFVIFVLVTTTCFVSANQVGDPPGERTTETVSSTTTGPATVSIDNIVNEFGLNLLKTIMKQNENKNVVISPVGIAGLLAMTLLGSAGTTYDELSQIIGFSQDILKNREHHENFGTQLHALNSNDTKTLYANAVFVDTHTRLRQVYRSYLERVYAGEALHVNFFETNKVKEFINEWVSVHTKSKIDNFLQQPLPASTKAVLLSALYFSGQWATPFVPEYTKKFAFDTPTKEVMVDLMANFGQFNYVFSVEDGIHMIQFPYNDSVTSMYVIKPRFPKRLGLTQLMDRLDNNKVENLIGQLSNKKCVVRFPKMELKSKIDMKDSLKALGAASMFTPGLANFAIMLDGTETNNDSEDNLISRINNGDSEVRSLKELVNQLENPGVHVDTVIHEVKINIDEYGTEAVAATSAVMARSAETFYANSPFYMFIRNEKTKLITFSALIFDPTE